MQSVRSRIWTRVVVSISYDDNDYTMGTSKEAVTKVMDTLTQEDLHGAFQKLLERYKCIATGGDYFEWGLEFYVCSINKSTHTKKVRELI